MQTSKSFTFTDTPTEVGSANNFTFEFPATHSVVSVEMYALGEWSPVASSKYTVESDTITRKVQNVDRSYKRFTTTGGNGSMTYRITLDKTLDQ